MSDDVLEQLKGFTPNASGLDRDALLFAAGRASAPSAVRPWLLVGLLALSQALTAGWLLMPSAKHSIPVLAPPSDFTPGERGPLTVRELPDEMPLPADQLAPDEPPLRAHDRTLFTSVD